MARIFSTVFGEMRLSTWRFVSTDDTAAIDTPACFAILVTVARPSDLRGFFAIVQTNATRFVRSPAE
jgi:hypothetical protein